MKIVHLFFLCLCLWASSNAIPESIRLEKVGFFPGLPASATVASDGHIYLTEFSGLFYRINAGVLQLVGNITDRVIVDAVEAFGVSWATPYPTIDPQYWFISYFNTAEFRFSRFPFNGSHIDVEDELIFIRINYTEINHPGGWIGISEAEGNTYLWMATGGFRDTGGDIENPFEITDPESFVGKMLRVIISPCANPTYCLDPESPFGNEVYAYGMRNPYYCAWNIENDLFCADPGQENAETLRRITIGGNFGWPYIEGDRLLPGVTDADQTIPEDFVFPQFSYSDQEGCSIIGGYFYNGTRFPWLVGKYIFSDFGCINAEGWRTPIRYFPAPARFAARSDWVVEDPFRTLSDKKRSILHSVNSIQPQNTLSNHFDRSTEERSDFSTPVSSHLWWDDLPVENVEMLETKFSIYTIPGADGEPLFFTAGLAGGVDIHTFSDAQRPAPADWSVITPTETLPVGRAFSKMIFTNKNSKERLIVFGGIFANGTYSAQLLEFNITGNSWKTLTPAGDVPSARAHHVFEYDGKDYIYLLGGEDAFSSFSDFWKYDIKDNFWTLIAANTTLSYRSKMSSVIYKKSLYVFGGTNLYQNFNDFRVYNLETESWSSITASGPSPRHSAYLMEGTQSKTLLLVGGTHSDSPNPFYNKEYKHADIWAYFVQTDTWLEVLSPQEAEVSKKAVSDGIFWTNEDNLFIGLGNDLRGSCLAGATQWYSPSDEIWTIHMAKDYDASFAFQRRNMKVTPPPTMASAFASDGETIYTTFGITAPLCVFQYPNDKIYTVPVSI